jgi:signal transduction histidine kinase
VRRRFRFSPSGGAPHDPWFHIGTLEVGTAVGVALLSAVALFVSAIVGFGSPLTRALELDPIAIVHGQVWRAITWPLAYSSFGLLTALTIALFWYFGRDLEDNLLGRKRMLQFVVWVTLACSLISVTIYVALGQYVPDATLSTLELIVLLAWIAEWPHRPFMFNIPAWVVGLVIVAVTLLGSVGSRNLFFGLYLVLVLAVSAMIAKSLGMLSEHHIVPHISRPKRAPKPPRSSRSPRHPSARGPRVVAGPWEGSSLPTQPTESRDEARMNALLEKIHASGQDSLSDAEKAELLALRDRLRRR